MVKYLNESEAIDIFETFKDMVDSDIPIDEELEIYEDAIKMINPFQMKQYFALKENKKYYLPVFKSIVAKWEGQQKPSSESKPNKKKLKSVNLIIEEDNTPTPTSSQEDSNAKLKQRQQAMKDKLKKINETPPVVPPQPKKITSPNGFGAFETYLLLRIQPDKDNEANNLIKMLERNFIERGFNSTTVKDIKKILKLAKYKDLVIAQEIQERINNPIVPVAPVAPSENLLGIQEVVPKKRGRPQKKKIEPGSNKLVLVDNIIKKNNEVTRLLRDYYNFVYEEGSQ